MADGIKLIFVLVFLIFVTCSGLISSESKEKGKIKIVEEPASYHGMGNSMYNFQSSQEKPLTTKVKPWKVSGPQHLFQLARKCFSLIKEGVWKQWIIVNNTFESMLMAEGDPCAGTIPRETKIVLKCGDSNTLTDVTEPTLCKYQMTFLTPLACPIDALLVYPSLSKEQKNEWEEIERDYYREELTFQGYNKHRNKLFIKAGFIPAPHKKEKPEADDVVENLVNGARSDENSQQNKRFHSTNQCIKAYEELLAEVEKLRELVNPTVEQNKNQSNVRNTNDRRTFHLNGTKEFKDAISLQSNTNNTNVDGETQNKREIHFIKEMHGWNTTDHTIS